MSSMRKLLEGLREFPLRNVEKTDRRPSIDNIETYIMNCANLLHDDSYDKCEIVAKMLVVLGMLIDRYGLSAKDILKKMEETL